MQSETRVNFWSTNSQTAALQILHWHGNAITAEFERLSERCPGAPAQLIEAMKYSLLAGGKRLRPALLLECFYACANENHSPTALAAATAMELIHTFSLVHDDLPAMDDDDLRRGRPTNHKVYGEAMAILAGDAMVATAFEVLATRADSALLPKLVYELASAAGPRGMIGGQVIDMASEDKSLFLAELRTLHAMKTGALLVASARMGVICAGASAEKLLAVTEFAKHIGLAFQIMDDVLDVIATPEQLGKATNKDAGRGKNTYPVLMGLEESKAAAETELTAALEALAPLGPAADGLRHLARFVVKRSS